MFHQIASIVDVAFYGREPGYYIQKYPLLENIIRDGNSMSSPECKAHPLRTQCLLPPVYSFRSWFVFYCTPMAVLTPRVVFTFGFVCLIGVMLHCTLGNNFCGQGLTIRTNLCKPDIPRVKWNLKHEVNSQVNHSEILRVQVNWSQ